MPSPTFQQVTELDHVLEPKHQPELLRTQIGQNARNNIRRERLGPFNADERHGAEEPRNQAFTP
eukprot:214090-Lingulodinium_polyedra.AAC.1